MKSDKWMLERLKFPDEHYLNIGDTTIGRNKNANIITQSDISSRQHCVITLNSDDTVYIVNQSKLNGTYVNEVKIEERSELKHNDVIGLGCNQATLNDPEEIPTCTKDQMFVYRLINKAAPCETFKTVIHDAVIPIEISDDDDDDDANDIKPVISNGIVKMEPTKNTNGANRLDINLSPRRNAEVASTSRAATNIPTSPSPIPIEEEDDNELIYSQQVLMEIKKEVNYSEEVITLDDDFTIYVSDDSSDGESANWAGKLSQDQDFVVKKVTESVQSKKRKATKPIEAMPLVPPKKGRRNSISSNTASTSSKITPSTITAPPPPPTTAKKTSAKIDKVELKIENRSPASNGGPIITAVCSLNASSVPSTEKNTQKKFVDHLDPYVKLLDKTDKPKSFEDAISYNVVVPKKQRIAYQPKTSGKLLSILRKENGAWPSELSSHGKKTKPVRRVQFSAVSDNVREYEPDDDEDREIIISTPTKPKIDRTAPQTVQLNSFENDPLHEIITDITEWKPEWLHQRNATPPINGVNHIVYPLMNSYTTFEHYKKTVTPLLKHELWSSIQAENRGRNSFEVKISSMNLEKRASRKRYIFHLQVAVESNSSKANVGDFVTVKDSNNYSFFAYITNQRFTRSGYTKTTYLTMEVSENVVKSHYIESQSLYITPIANIRAELKLFNAVFYLNRTPLKSLILDPIKYKEPTIPNRIPKFRYTGYDKLNDEQLEILKAIYNKSVNSSTSLSLIEGPPGTGKTRLIISIILQLLFGQEMKQKLRILVLASSNMAVDIIAKRLLHIRDKMDSDAKKNMMYTVRFGVINSMDPDVRQIAPQNLKDNQPMSPSAQSDSINQLLKEEKSLQIQINELRKKESATTTVVQDRIKALEKRIMQVKETIDRSKVSNGVSDFDGIYRVMANARVICSTLSSAINLKQYIRYFDVCIIDEASQCTEPWSLVALQYQIKSLILVGDPNQLAPVVLSPVCRENNFEQSLFARLFHTIPKNDIHDGKNKYEMTVQYRMHPDICQFSNRYFYEKRLTSAPQTVQTCSDFPLHAYRVFHLNCTQSNADMISFCNADEAEFICAMLKVMTKHAKPENYSYGIITPYAKQRAEIQNRLISSNELSKHKIPVNTIDSYQGQEKDIIILCTTRTTGIGFLANPQRLNVALTRAKKCLVICGNFKSISNVPVWRELLKNAETRKKYFEIPKQYNFQTIADLMVMRQQQKPKQTPTPKPTPKPKPKPSSSKSRQ